MFHYYTGFFICLYKIIFIINIFIILKCWTYKFQHFCLRINIKVLLFVLYFSILTNELYSIVVIYVKCCKKPDLMF